MKTLYLIRHAKSSWDDPGLDDPNRPLNERGKKDAPRMGKRLKEREVTVDLMISSPAKRAAHTSLEIAKALNYPERKIKMDKSLYHAGEDAFLSVLKATKDANTSVMIFGHNPGLTEFANNLFGETITNIPTTGIVAGQLNIDSWRDIKPGCGKMLFFDFPKKSKAD